MNSNKNNELKLWKNLTDVNYNDVDYGSNDMVTITMSIRYDNAIQTTGGGVGAPGITQFNTAAITG